MPLISPEIITQIAAANDIVEVVQGYFPLKRAGVMWKACCPFHQERTPSFSVNPQRQIFKCFGCGAGGTVIRFVMNYENLDFISAARKLAERAGIRIVEAEMSPEDVARYGLRRRVLALHAEAAEFFHHLLLRKTSAQTARDYLKSRGIGGEIAKSWKLGYAPDSFDSFSHFAREAGFSARELVESGLVKLRNEEQREGAFFDRFRNRVMFPICNDLGEVIAFSGRVLAAEAKEAKYVNSPETMLFSKGAVLFGLHKSKRALIDKASAIVCEGQLDLITAFEAGVTNVVAPQGTAFTQQQAHKLKQYVEEVVLCFDADAAGEKAAERSLPRLLHESLLVRVIEMPPGEDPDSLIRGQGAEAFRQRAAGARDFFDFQFERLAGREDFASPRGKLQAARKMAESISLITDAVMREAVMSKVTQRLEISTKEFSRMLKAPRAGGEVDEPPPTAEPLALSPAMRLLLQVCLHDAAAREWLLGEPWEKQLSQEPDGALLKHVLRTPFQSEDPASTASLLATLSPAEEDCVAGLLEGKAPANPMAIAHDCWRDLERRQVRRSLESAQARLRRPGLSSEETGALLQEVLEQQKHLMELGSALSPPL